MISSLMAQYIVTQYSGVEAKTFFDICLLIQFSYTGDV